MIKQFTQFRWLLVVTIFTGFTVNLHAQSDSSQVEVTSVEDVSDEDFYELSLEDLLNMDFELSTGSFLEMDLKSSPTSLTLISKEQIRNSGARHLSELLEIYVPGFQYMANKWNGIIWGMRGVAASRNTKFIFLVNGHKMNHESRDGAMSELDLGLLGDIERVEVLRGPAGLVYGSGAIAGVVNIVTKTVDEANNELTTNVHSWKMQSFGGGAEILANKQVNEDFGINISMGYRASNGTGNEVSKIQGRGSWPYLSERPLDDGTSTPWLKDQVPQNGIPTTGAAWSTPGNFKVGATLNYKDLKIYTRTTHQVTNASQWFPVDGWPDVAGYAKNDSTAGDRIIDGAYRSPDSFYGYIEPYGTDRRQYVMDNVMLMAEYDLAVGENEVVFSAGYDGVTNRIQRQDFTQYSNGANNAVERDVFIEETFGERRYDLGALYNLKTVDKLQLAVGYQFRFFDIGDDLSGTNAVGMIDKHKVVSDVQYTNHAVFTEGLYDLNDMFAVNFGARYDIHTRTKQHGGIVSPKLALITKLNDNNVIKLIFQSSANNGSADTYELNRWHYDNNGETVDNYIYEKPDVEPTEKSNVLPPAPTQEELDNLKPERATSLELASVHDIGGKFLVAPSLSYTSITNLFVWDQSRFRELNGDGYNVFNVDLEAKYVTEKIDLGINHTFQKPVNTDIDQVVTYETPVWDHANPTVNPDGTYSPNPKTDADGNVITQTTEIESIKSSISEDGSNFLNLVTNITKLYLDYSPSEYLTLHTSIRTFWGLQGRQHVQDQNPQFNYYGAHNSAMVKMNIGIHIKPSEMWMISFMAYDILARDAESRNSFRWQQHAEPSQTDFFASDIRSFAMNLSYKF